MNHLEEMTARALTEFDRMVAEREHDLRFQMKAAGATPVDIEACLEACRPALAEQRAGIAPMVTVALLKAGVPLMGVNDNVLP